MDFSFASYFLHFHMITEAERGCALEGAPEMLQTVQRLAGEADVSLLLGWS